MPGLFFKIALRTRLYLNAYEGKLRPVESVSSIQKYKNYENFSMKISSEGVCQFFSESNKNQRSYGQKKITYL